MIKSNEKYGKLTTIKRYDGTNPFVRWECRCDCGNIVIIYQTYLKKNCTSKQCENCNKRKPVKIGQKIGKIEVVSLIKSDCGYKYDKFLCQCECGKTRELGRAFLSKRRKSTSCGEYPCKIAHNNKFIGEIPKVYFSQIKNVSKKKGREFSITHNQLWELFLKQNRKCAISGLNLKFSRKKLNDGTASLDRIDSNKGYTIDNIQWVHKVVNSIKNDRDEKDFIHWCKVIVEYHKDRFDQNYILDEKMTKLKPKFNASK